MLSFRVQIQEEDAVMFGQQLIPPPMFNFGNDRSLALVVQRGPSS
jgi:hypothetical protein